MIELRDYQLDLLDRLCDALERGGVRIMLQLPTGGGKTHISGELLSRWLKDGRKAVWLTHRRELAGQTEGMLREGGIPATANILWDPGTSAPAIASGIARELGISRITVRKYVEASSPPVYPDRELAAHS